jgi:hypothetical protein
MDAISIRRVILFFSCGCHRFIPPSDRDRDRDRFKTPTLQARARVGDRADVVRQCDEVFDGTRTMQRQVRA